MNKISLIKNKTLEESHDNKVTNKKKNKFKKFLSSSMAVMVLTVGLSAPMTLRADESKEEKKDYTIEDVVDLMKQRIEENNEKIEENNQIIEQSKKRIEENNRRIEISKKKIEEAKKQEMEAKKQEMEARNKLKERCMSMGNNIQLAEKYCSENECTKEQKNILNESKNTYNEECVRFMAKSE